MPTKPGKQPTKGKKQIVEENKSTLKFYLYVSLSAVGIYLIPYLLFLWSSFTFLPIFMFIISGSIYIGAYQFMSYMSRPTYDASSSVILDSGTDLNLKEGMAEHTKDLILLTAIVQVLSLISNYFWLLLLLAPGRAFYILWVNILAPWIFAPAPEVNEKKEKKMERKIKYRR